MYTRASESAIYHLRSLYTEVVGKNNLMVETDEWLSCEVWLLAQFLFPLCEFTHTHTYCFSFREVAMVAGV